MSAPKRGVSNATADRYQLYRQILIATIYPHHFKRTVDRKRSDGICERDTAAQCQACGNTYHHLLGDADVDEALRKFCLKSSGARHRRNIGDDKKEPRVRLGDFIKSVGKGVSHD